MSEKKTNPNNQNEADAIREYWTEERRERALPAPLPTVEREEVEKLEEEEQSKINEGALIIPPNSTIESYYFTSGAERPGEGSTKGFPVKDPSKHPYASVGKLYYKMGSIDYVGSGWLLANKIIMTAAHCLKYKGEVARDMIFFPAEGTKHTYGHAIKKGVWCKKWNGVDNFAYDYGLAVTYTETAPFGSWGAVFDGMVTVGVETAYGYPSSPPYPSPNKTMYEVTGDVSASRKYIGEKVMTSNDFTEGSSGGPWVGKTEHGVKPVGVMSNRVKGGQEAYSPIIQPGDFRQLLEEAKKTL